MHAVPGKRRPPRGVAAAARLVRPVGVPVLAPRGELLRGRLGQLRTGHQHPGVGLDPLVQLAGRQHLVDQAGPQRPLRTDQLAGEQQVLRRRRARQRDQPAGRRRGVDDPEPGGGDAERRALFREPQIAGRRQLASAAHAVAAHRGERRPGEGGQRLLRRHRELLRGARGIAQGGDVGSGAEGLPGARQHQDPDRGVGGRPRQEFGHGAPHRGRHGVALGGIADDEGGDAVRDGELQPGFRTVHAPDAIRTVRTYDQEGVTQQARTPRSSRWPIP